MAYAGTIHPWISCEWPRFGARGDHEMFQAMVQRRFDTPLRLINDINVAYVRLFAHKAARVGLTRPQWHVLGGIRRQDGITQSELAGAIAMGKSPLGKVVDKLEAEGLIERRPDPNDRRANRLHLTEKAGPLMEPAAEVVEQLEQLAFDGLNDDQAEHLIDLLTDMRARMEAALTAENLPIATPTDWRSLS